MGFFRKFFSKTANVVTASVIAAVPVIAVSAVLLSGTFAAGDDVTDTFYPVSDTYLQISVHGTRNDVRGTKVAISSNLSVITTDVTVNPPVLTGEAPGIAAVSYLTSIGAGRNITYQVYDPNGIAGYRIPGGKMEVSKAGGDPQLVNLKLYIDAQNNGNVTDKNFTDWNNDHPDNKIVWKSLHTSIVTVDPDTGYFTAVDNGAANLIGTVTDKWGNKQSIPVLVTVGTAAYVIDAEDGTYWLPGDAPNTYFETDDTGKIKVPPRIIYNPNGPGNGNNIELYQGDDGKYYVPDDNYPNIWHEFDTIEGKVKTNGKSIWGGLDWAPGGGDDKDALYSNNTGFYYANLGQNVYQKVDRIGDFAGLISNNKPIGGGGDSTPGTGDDLNNIILWGDGKYYSGPYTDGQFSYYIGDMPLNAGGNGQLNTSGNGSDGHATPIAGTDMMWYLDSNGNLVPDRPAQPATVTGVTVTPGPVLDMSVGTFMQFLAVVTGTNNPPQTVAWTVSGNQSPGTIISNDGMLTIPSDELSGTITVTATSLLDSSKSAMVTIYVKPSGPQMQRATSDKITAGSSSFIIKDDGSLWGAGYNVDGQLGLGDTTKRLAWTPIMPGTKFQAVSEYTYGCDCHVLALTTDGKLYAWGNNTYGEVGDGTTTRRTTPILIMSNLSFKDIATGCHFSMAITTDGKLYTWGCNPYGELGEGSTSTRRATPAQNTALVSIPLKEISAGEHFAAALAEDGRLFTWGLNNYGQLGDGTTTTRTTPNNIMSDKRFQSVSVQSFGHALALTTDNRLFTWGRNNYGQLGDGSKTNRKNPMEVFSGTKFGVIRTGRYYSMGLTADGRLFTWGYNVYGQLGVGNKSDLTVPTQVTPGVSYMAISAGEHTSMAVTNSGYLFMWGNNAYGQYGNGLSGTGTLQSKTIPLFIPLS